MAEVTVASVKAYPLDPVALSALRDYFAGQALTKVGMVWYGNREEWVEDCRHAAEQAYAMADAMLTARAAK